MTEEQLDDWTTKLGKVWTAQNPDQAMQLVNRDTIEWYENPLDEPITSWSEVYKLWAVIPNNQKDVSFSHKIIACSDGFGIINWQAKLTKVPSDIRLVIDGIFMVKIADDGTCTYFKQWEVERQT